jgi:hypothetical protein
MSETVEIRVVPKPISSGENILVDMSQNMKPKPPMETVVKIR